MGTSQETISKVKNLLRKLDQGIDAARDRRLATNEPALTPQTLPTAPVPALNSPPRARPLAPRFSSPPPRPTGS